MLAGPNSRHDPRVPHSSPVLCAKGGEAHPQPSLNAAANPATTTPHPSTKMGVSQGLGSPRTGLRSWGEGPCVRTRESKPPDPPQPGFVSGHDFSRATTTHPRTGLQPPRNTPPPRTLRAPSFAQPLRAMGGKASPNPATTASSCLFAKNFPLPAHNRTMGASLSPSVVRWNGPKAAANCIPPPPWVF